MSRIIGIRNMAFTGKDGTPVEGKSLYVTDPIDPKQGKGDSADKIFLSASKLASLDFTPEPGQEIAIFYNKYGKPATLKLDDLDFGPEID